MKIYVDVRFMQMIYRSILDSIQRPQNRQIPHWVKGIDQECIDMRYRSANQFLPGTATARWNSIDEILRSQPENEYTAVWLYYIVGINTNFQHALLGSRCNYKLRKTRSTTYTHQTSSKVLPLLEICIHDRSSARQFHSNEIHLSGQQNCCFSPSTYLLFLCSSFIIKYYLSTRKDTQ